MVGVFRFAVSILVLTIGFCPGLRAQCNHWERIESQGVTPEDRYTAVAWGGNNFLVADSQELFTSDDGWDWSQVPCAMSSQECQQARWINATVWDRTDFIAIGSSNLHLVYRISENGLAIAGTCAPGGFESIAYNGSTYVTVNHYLVATSADAASWNHHLTPEVDCLGDFESPLLESVTWTGSRWIAVGDRVVAMSDGVLLVRDCIPPAPRSPGARVP